MKGLANKRVVITGISSMTPLGMSLDETWQNIMQNKTALRIVDPSLHPYLDYPIAGAELPEEAFSNEFIKAYKVKHSDSSFFAQANYCFMQAMRQAKLMDDNRKIIDWVPRDRLGLELACNYYYVDMLPEIAQQKGDEVTRNIAFGLPHALAMEYELEGRVFSNTMTCASSVRNIGTAMDLIQEGVQDIMVVGTHDYSSKGVSSAFMAELKQHGTVLDKPDRSLRPFDKEAKGIASADAGGFFVLESLESAERRGVQPIVEVKGYGHNRIANELLPLSLEGFLSSCNQGFEQAGWEPKDVDAIISHAAGTTIGSKQEADFYKVLLSSSKSQLESKKYKMPDEVEVAEISPASIISFKGYLGHANIANGIIESALLIKCMQENTICGSYGLNNPIYNDLNFALEGVHQKKEVKKGVKVAFGFGGINNMVCFEKL